MFKLLLKPEILPDAQFIDPTLGPIVYEGTWKMFTFLGYGNPVTMNNLQFQELADALYDVKGIWNAYASLIAPNATIRFHRTLSKGLLRWFIPLQNDGLDLLFFNNGNSLDQTILKLDHTIIFDSTTMHSIVNRGSSWSLMLVLDTLRPLEEFSLAFNRLSLGTIARHKLIEEGLQRAAIDLRGQI